MASRLVQAIALCCGLATAMAICASPAAAAATFTVSAGSARTGATVPITGTTQGASPQIKFVDTTTSQTLTCASGSAPGTTKVGTGLPGAGIGKITGSNTKWNGCTGPAGLQFVVTGAGTWLLNAKGFSAGVAHGTITAVTATVNDAGVCKFKVTGSVSVSYRNSNQTLTVPGTTSTLTISNVSGCLGVLNNGDKAAFTAKYLLKANRAAFNPIAITSP